MGVSIMTALEPTRQFNKRLVWSIISAVIRPNLVSGLKPGIMMRASGICWGRKSFQQKALQFPVCPHQI